MFRVFTCLTGDHDLRLVAVAGIVCFLASLVAITLFERARVSQGRARAGWTITAGAATGCGIWATHFIAMLAYEPSVTIAYDIGLTVLSLFAAMAVTSIGLSVAVGSTRAWAAPAGGGIVGGGVAAMHYLGMWALELPGRVTWEGPLVLASITFGMLFAMAAMQIAIRRTGVVAAMAAALLLTLSIVSHHFTAMAAVEIIPDPTRAIQTLSLSPNALALAVAGAAISVLGMCLVGAFSDRRSQNQLREQNQIFDAALNNMCHGLTMFDPAGRLLVCNRRYLEMYKLTREEVRPGCSVADLLAHHFRVGVFTGDRQRYVDGIVREMVEQRDVHKVIETGDGRTIAVTNRTTASGRVSVHEDITERCKAERARDTTQAFLNTVIENVPATLIVKDAREHRYVLINRAGEEFFGLRRDEMIGKTAYDFFSREEADGITRRDEEVVRSGRQVVLEEHPLVTPGNGTRLVNTKRLAIPGDNGEPAYMLSVLEDVTERKRAEARIAHLAHHDGLTGLPNRSALNEHLVAAVDQAKRTGEQFAVLSSDLDRFKEVNDVFGHSVGDALLEEIARRLQAAADGAFVGRTGGDEFILIAAGPQPATAEAIADRLISSVAGELTVADQALRVRFTIGIAVFPTDGTDPATLLANTDAALYRAKAEARGSIRFFEPDMDQHLRERRALQVELRSAVDRGELDLHYQPQATIDGVFVGFEALLRWNHPTRGMVPPTKFIPVAEDSGLIVEIGEWVLRQACLEAVSWAKPLEIAINLSPIQFQHGDLPALVHTVLLETGLAPPRLTLEITEGVLIGDFSRALSILRRLKGLGVRIAMDDFGTGYSSLSYLQAFPFDKIKIDRAFIANLERSEQSAAIVRAVIGLGHGLKLPIIAEGVETQAQLAFLSRETCDEVQGYLLGRPLPIAAYAEQVGRPVRAEASAAVG